MGKVNECNQQYMLRADNELMDAAFWPLISSTRNVHGSGMAGVAEIHSLPHSADSGDCILTKPFLDRST